MESIRASPEVEQKIDELIKLLDKEKLPHIVAIMTGADHEKKAIDQEIKVGAGAQYIRYIISVLIELLETAIDNEEIKKGDIN